MNAAHNYVHLRLWKVHVAAGMKLEIVQKTAELTVAPEDDERDPFADLDDNEEELENNKIIVKNYTS